MTKAKTVGAKRRSKGGRPRKEGPRQPNGQPSRAGHREAAKRVNIIARCKLLGWLPRTDEDGRETMMPTAEMAKRASAPHMGFSAGRATDGEPDGPKLWEAARRIYAVYHRYWQSIGAPSPYAKAAKVELMPEPFGSEGVEVVPYDDRTEEEKCKAAANAMMRVETVLGMAGEGVAREVKSVVLGDEAVRDKARLLSGLRALDG